MEYLMPAAFLAVAFFLGAFITNFFKSKTISTLTQEAQGAQSRFYELQNSTKKELSEKAITIKQLRSDISKQEKNQDISQGTSLEDAKSIKELKEKNSSLKKELQSIRAKNKELKVEKAVNKVEKKYPMQLYGMDGDSAEDKAEKNVKTKKSKKIKSKTVLSDDDNIASVIKSLDAKSDKKGKSKTKSKKSKKKSKSKKRKSKKVLALFGSKKKGKKSKKSKKGKKLKNKAK